MGRQRAMGHRETCRTRRQRGDGTWGDLYCEDGANRICWWLEYVVRVGKGRRGCLGLNCWQVWLPGTEMGRSWKSSSACVFGLIISMYDCFTNQNCGIPGFYYDSEHFESTEGFWCQKTMICESKMRIKRSKHKNVKECERQWKKNFIIDMIFKDWKKMGEC